MRQLMKYFSASFLFISMVVTSSIAIAADYKVALYILVLQGTTVGIINMTLGEKLWMRLSETK